MIVCRKKGIRASYRFFKEDYVEVECPEYDALPEAENAEGSTLFEKNTSDDAADGVTCPTAKTAMICSLVGIPFCGFIFGAVGIFFALKALKEIKAEPAYRGETMAKLAFLLGVCDIALYAVLLAASPSLLRAFSVFIF